MKLSIIVPTYDCRDYLDECLKSVLDQLWDDSELKVVDDGSDDGTDRMLEGYKDNPHIKILLCAHIRAYFVSLYAEITEFNVVKTLPCFFSIQYKLHEEKRLVKGDIPVFTVWNCRHCDSAAVAGLI